MSELTIPEEQLRNKLRDLKRPTKTDFRYPIEAYEDDLVELIQTHTAAEVQKADKTLDSVLKERDSLEGRLDSLSQAVAAYFKQDIGEHSSANDPWYNAFELLRDNTRAHPTQSNTSLEEE